MNFEKEYKYDAEKRRFVEVKSNNFRNVQKVILLIQVAAFIAISIIFFGNEYQNKNTASLGSYQGIAGQRDSSKVTIPRDSVQLSNENIRVNIEEIKDSIRSLEESVNEYEIAFREMSEIGLDDAVSVPMLQQKVSSLDRRIDWLWQVYWSTAMTIIIGIVGIYVSLLRKSYIKMESYHEEQGASESEE